MPLRLVAEFQDSLMLRIADVTIFTGALTYPWWREGFHDWSEVASDLAPYLAALWFITQIVCRIYSTTHHRKDD